LDEKQIWKELKKYGIHNEKELDEAISNTRLNISGFVTKPTIHKKIKCDATHN